MGLFSGSASRRAGLWGYLEAQKATDQAQGLLDRGRTDALNAIGTGRTNALSSIGQGYDAARPQYQMAMDRLDPWSSAGEGALATLQNSLGQNGALGNAAAVRQFQESPGYRYSVDQATDSVARKASALGSLGSGNTAAAISDRAQQMANQEYGGWQDRLTGLSNTGLTAANAQAGIQRGLGDLNAQQGRDTASIYTDAAGREAGIYGNFSQLGMNNIWNGANTGISSIQQGVQNGRNAAASGLNFGLGLLGTGIGLFGLPMGGGATLGGNLMSSLRG